MLMWFWRVYRLPVCACINPIQARREREGEREREIEIERERERGFQSTGTCACAEGFEASKWVRRYKVNLSHMRGELSKPQPEPKPTTNWASISKYSSLKRNVCIFTHKPVGGSGWYLWGVAMPLCQATGPTVTQLSVALVSGARCSKTHAKVL